MKLLVANICEYYALFINIYRLDSLSVAWGVFLLVLAMADVVVRLTVGFPLLGRGRTFIVMGFWRIFSVSEARTSGDQDENSGTGQQNENNYIAGCEHDMNLSRR